MTDRHVVLLGPMGAGKTSLGVRISQELSVAFIDSDTVLFERFGITGAEIAATIGVEELHRREIEGMADALSASNRVVVAAAASVIDDPDARSLLRRHLCIWVEADPASLSARRLASAHRRSLTDEESERLNDGRRKEAMNVTVGQVDTSTSTVEESVAVAMRILSEHLSNPSR